MKKQQDLKLLRPSEDMKIGRKSHPVDFLQTGGGQSSQGFVVKFKGSCANVLINRINKQTAVRRGGQRAEIYDTTSRNRFKVLLEETVYTVIPLVTIHFRQCNQV